MPSNFMKLWLSKRSRKTPYHHRILYSCYFKNLLDFDVFSLIEVTWIWHIVQFGEFEITSSFIVGSSAVKDDLLQCRNFCWGQWKSVLFIEVRNKLFDSWMVLKRSDFFWTDQAFYWKIKLFFYRWYDTHR